MKRFPSLYRLMLSACCYFIFNCLPFFSNAQFRFEHSIQQVAHAGMLYADMENRILVTGTEMDADCLFSSSAGSVVQAVAGGLIIRPGIAAGTDTIRLIKSGVVLGSRIFRVLPQADPLPQLAFRPDTSMPLGRILANPFLGVWHPDGRSASGMRIVSFNCSVRNPNGKVFYFSSTGNRLTPDMLAAIKSLPGESVIEFDQVRVKLGPDQPGKFLAPLKVVVK